MRLEEDQILHLGVVTVMIHVSLNLVFFPSGSESVPQCLVLSLLLRRMLHPPP